MLAKSAIHQVQRTSSKHWFWLTILMLIVGSGLRITRYATDQSFWLDETLLSANLIQRDFSNLHKPLYYRQVGDYGYLAATKLSTMILGETELAYRLLPLLASLASLIIFASLARRLLKPFSAWAVVTMMAVTEPMIYYAAEAKPYTIGLFITLLLLWFAIQPASDHRKRNHLPKRSQWIGLAITGAVGVWFSLSSIFIMAGIGLTLPIKYLLTSSKKNRRNIVLLAVIWLTSFASAYLISNTQNPSTKAFLLNFWKDHFLPISFNATMFQWLGHKFLGLFGDPLGLHFSGLAAIFCLIGCLSLLRKNPRLLALYYLPILFLLGTSAFSRYPFGTPEITRWFYDDLTVLHPYLGRVIFFTAGLWLLLIGHGIDALLAIRSCFIHRLSYFAIILLLLPEFYTSATNATSPPKKQAIRELTTDMRSQYHQGDFIYVSVFMDIPIRYYAARMRWPIKLGIYNANTPQQLASINQLINTMAPGTRVWIGLLDLPIREPQRRQFKNWESQRQQFKKIAAIFDRHAKCITHLRYHDAQAILFEIGDKLATPATPALAPSSVPAHLQTILP